MKSPVLFCYLLAFITCCVFTWKAESSSGEAMGYIALLISIIGIAKNIPRKINA